MHIKTIKIEGFRSFKDPQSITLSPKTNIIIGKNGTGKSSIITAMQFLLLQKPFITIKKDDRKVIINEGIQNNRIASVEATFDNSDFRFPIKKSSFVLKRVLTIDNDYFLLDDRNIKKEELQGMLENSGIIVNTTHKVSKGNEFKFNETEINHDILNDNKTDLNKIDPNKIDPNKNDFNKIDHEFKFVDNKDASKIDTSFFIVPQGKITQLATFTNYQRLLLIKEIAGANIYEQDKQNALTYLNEAKLNETKIQILLNKIKMKMKTISANQKINNKREKIDLKLKVVKNRIYELEIKEVESRLKNYNFDKNENTSDESENIEDDNDISLKIRDLQNEINILEKEKYKTEVKIDNYKNEFNDQNINLLNNDQNINLLNNDQNINLLNNDQNINIKSLENELFNITSLEEKINSQILNLKKRINYFEHEKEENELKIKSKEFDKMHKYQNQSLDELKKLLDIKKKEFMGLIESDNKENLANQNYKKYCKSDNHVIYKAEDNYNNNNEYNSNDKYKYNSNYNDDIQFSTKSLSSLIKIRKNLWIEENKLKEKLQMLKTNLSKNENQLMLKHSIYSTYQEIKKYPGVHGLVFELFNCPEELMNAIEAVFGSSFLNIIVDNENVAIDLLRRIKTRVTFLPINRIKNEVEFEETEKNDSRNFNNHNTNNNDLRYNSDSKYNLNNHDSINTIGKNNLNNHNFCNEKSFNKKSFNKKSFDEQSFIADESIPLLSTIQTDPVYQSIYKYLCKNTYLVTDLKSGTLISKTKKVNTVTLGGDFISKKGVISGGFEKKDNLIKILKNNFQEIKKNEEEIEKVKTEIKKVDDQIKELEIKKTDGNNNLNSYNQDNYQNKIKNLKILILFLEEKIASKKSSINITTLKNKKIHLMQEISKHQIEIENLVFEKRNLKMKIKKLEMKIELLKSISYKNSIEIKISNLKNELQLLNEKLTLLENKNVFERTKKFNLKREIERNEMNLLIEKRKKLIEKIGLVKIDVDFESSSSYSEDEKDSTKKININDKKININDKNIFKNINKIDDLKILNSLVSTLNQKLKNLPIVNRTLISKYDDFIQQKERLLERKNDLDTNRCKIAELINDLDNKKNNAIELTFSMISNQFTFIYKELTGKLGILKKSNDGVEILIKREFNENNQFNTNEKKLIDDDKFKTINLNQLSGGQKTIIALTLLFSIQQVDPSPFYFFDEVDANLDENSRFKVSNFISKINSQFLITTFKKEFLSCGDKFFKVGFDKELKMSNVNDINRDEAMNDLV
ncbi:Chromosome segregation protein sudA [Dictyocoela muelleri]|nr:Chromosome segregation protein sudA [Dictyocoela muelleri]